MHYKDGKMESMKEWKLSLVIKEGDLPRVTLESWPWTFDSRPVVLGFP